jgi:hypothetical protein
MAPGGGARPLASAAGRGGGGITGPLRPIGPVTGKIDGGGGCGDIAGPAPLPRGAPGIDCGCAPF